MAGHPRKTSCTKNRTKELRLSLESYIWLLGLIFWKFIRFKNFQKPLKSLESDVITDLSDYKFITVIRHPLKRLVSAYSDKIGRGSTRVSRQYYWHNYGREIISRYRKNYPKLTQGKGRRDQGKGPSRRFWSKSAEISSLPACESFLKWPLLSKWHDSTTWTICDPRWPHTNVSRIRRLRHCQISAWWCSLASPNSSKWFLQYAVRIYFENGELYWRSFLSFRRTRHAKAWPKCDR